MLTAVLKYRREAHVERNWIQFRAGLLVTVVDPEPKMLTKLRRQATRWPEDYDHRGDGVFRRYWPRDFLTQSFLEACWVECRIEGIKVKKSNEVGPHIWFRAQDLTYT